MSRMIPRNRVPAIAAWLADQGHDLLTAPQSLVQLALEDPRMQMPEIGERPADPHDRRREESWSWWF